MALLGNEAEWNSAVLAMRLVQHLFVLAAASLLRPPAQPSLLQRTTPLTDLLSQAKEELTARQVSCKAELEKGAVQVDDARTIASVSQNILGKAQSDLQKVQVELENVQKNIYAIKDNRPKLREECAVAMDLKKTQHGLVSADADIMGAMVAGLDCSAGALLQCGSEMKPAASLVQLARGLTSDTARLLPAFFQQTPEPEPAPPTPCVIPPVARCANIADGISQLHSQLKDKTTTMAMTRQSTDEACRLASSTAINQQKALRGQKLTLNDKVQFAMTRVTTAEKTSTARTEEFQHLETLVNGWATQCSDDIKNLEYKVAQVTRIRAKKEGLVSDCQVSEWQMGPCSVDCGGGTRNVTRKVTSPPDANGHACPVLERVAECNRKECPRDCEMADWGLWSACSLQCGGGTQTRNRFIQVPAKGGVPCGGVSETQLCNMDSCDVDCVLSDWTLFGPCSQRCGGGAQKRTRSPSAAAIGAGVCWEWDDPLRREFKPCAATPCVEAPALEPGAAITVAAPVDPAAGFEKCEAELDVVLLLDASGSLDDAAWMAQKTTAVGVLERMPGVNHVGVIQYAGEASVIAPLGSQSEASLAIQGAFTRLPPAGSDFANALGAARRMLLGRQHELRATVVLFTDGRADTAAKRRDQASRDLREVDIRVLAVAATTMNVPGLDTVTTYPPYANTVTAASFEALDPVAIARTLCPPKKPVPTAIPVAPA